MRRALTLSVTAVALAALAASAQGQSRTHVRDVRVGAHEGYDRVVVELDGPAEIAWERGPEPGAETFYLDADLGRRERVVATKLAQVGTLTLRAMRVGTRLVLEPRERRLRAYLLAKPTRLVIDVAGPGEGKFEVPAGLTALAPAKSVGPLENAPVPEAEPQAPPEPAPQPEPAPVTAEPSAEPVEGAVEPPSEATPREAAPETPSPETAPPETAPPETAAPETAPEPAPEEPKAVAVPAPEPTPPPPEVTPPPAPMPPPPPETGFPWGLALGTLAVLAALGGLGAALWRTRAAPELEAPFRPRPKPTPTGVDEISVDELRGATDATTVLEQRLDEEVRARLALEERLTQAGEELKVLRDRLHRVERRREEAH